MKKFEYVMLSAAKHLGVSFKTNTLRSFALLRMTGLADFFTASIAVGHRMTPAKAGSGDHTFRTTRTTIGALRVFSSDVAVT